MLALVCGLPKSASSFAAQMARAIADAAGFDQAALRSRVKLDGGPLRAGEVLVVKTHGPRPGFSQPLEAQGLLRALVTFRDPRDAALSAYEAGVRAREKCDTSQSFVNLDSIRSSIDSIAKHWEYTSTWLDDELSLKLEYEDLTGNARILCAKLVKFMGFQ